MVEMPRVEQFRQAEQKAEAVALADASPARPGRSFVKRAGLALALLAGTAAGVSYGHAYWTEGRFLVATDDAYVQTDFDGRRAKGFRVRRPGAGERQPAGEGRPGSGADRRQ